MIYYKVRRKSDGKFARNYQTRSIDGRGWGVGQVYSEKAFLDVRRLYNSIGGRNSNYVIDKTTGHYHRVSLPQAYNQLELVKFGPGGEVVVWTDSQCVLTAEDAKQFEPTGQAEPSLIQRQAGIRDEIGGLLDQIEAAETALESGTSYNFDGLYSEIDVKQYKLKAALDELVLRNSQLKDKIKRIYLGE